MKVKVTFETYLPKNATDEQIIEWLRFIFMIDSIKVSNPLANKELDVLASSVEWRRI